MCGQGARSWGLVHAGGLEVAQAQAGSVVERRVCGPRRSYGVAVLDVEPRVGAARRVRASRPLFPPL